MCVWYGKGRQTNLSTLILIRLDLTHLLHHFTDEEFESGLGNIVTSVLSDVVCCQHKDAQVVITKSFDLHVEGGLEDSFHQV